MASSNGWQRFARFAWPWAKAAEPKGPVVAVIELRGVLQQPSRSRQQIPGGSIYFDKVKKDVDRAFDLKELQAVALDINCPGGAPAQCEKISSYIRNKSVKHKVPVMAFAGDIAASGGYWLMCAADELYTCRTSLVGSIGVVGNSFGFVDVIKRLGIERRIAVAGDKKISTDPFSEQTEDQKSVQKEIMGSLHGSFIDYVKERRGSALENPDKSATHSDLFSGRVWTGSDAVKVGLVDKIGTLDEVILDKHGEKIRIQRFGAPKVPWWAQIGPQSSSFSNMSVSTVAEEFFEVMNTRMLWERYRL